MGSKDRDKARAGTWGTLRARVGRRGAFLLFLATLDTLIGYSLLTLPGAETAALHMGLPLSWWAGAWLTVGAVCAAGAFVRRDFAAYALAATLKVAWAIASAWAWLTYHIPQGWVGVIIWVMFATITLLISSWPEAFQSPGQPQGPP